MDNSTYIPVQREGKQFDVAAEVVFDSNTEALLFFQQVKQRLLSVNHWDEFCQLPSATFRLMNPKNQEIVGLAKENDFIRINIPGPGTKAGGGYDWVNVEKIQEHLTADFELLSMTVRPTHHPLKPGSGTAHFFSKKSTSTFQVKRMENRITAEVHGRNEISNPEGMFIDRFRNVLIAFGAKIGFSYPQWKLLVEGLVRK